MKKINKLLSLILVVCTMFLLNACSINKREVIESHDINNYGIYKTDLYLIPDYNDAPIVFPENIRDITVNDFYTVKINQAGKEVGYHIVLDVTFSEQDYISEITRLEEWQRSYEYEGSYGKFGFLPDEKNFEHPVFVASYNCFLAYEYAMLLEENRILYVYIRNIEEGESPINKEYLPKNYYKNNASINGFRFSVYYNRDLFNQDIKINN